MKLLITGFGQFDHFSENPSGELARLVDGETVHGVRIFGLQLDVSWRDAWPPLERAVRRLRPDALLSFGLADNDPTVRLETTARNVAGPIPDFFGRMAPSRRIEPHGPDAYGTTLPVHWLFEQYERENPVPIHARYSDDAGNFLCNYLFYRIMHQLEEEIPLRGFVHIPAYPADNQAWPYSKTDVLAAAARMVALVARFMRHPPASMQKWVDA